MKKYTLIMIPAISREGMITIDKKMVNELGINVPLMMEHAGYFLAKLSKKIGRTNTDGHIVISGTGNNGGGGQVAARRLHNWGEDVILYLPKGGPERVIPKEQYQRAKSCGVDIVFEEPEVENQLLIDAFIGYNFHGELRGITKETVEYMRDQPLIALDVPTGIDSTTGENKGLLKPKATMTLAWPKSGMLNMELENLGDIYLADIGIPNWLFSEEDLFEKNKPTNDQLDKIGQTFGKDGLIKINITKGGWEI